MDARQHDTMREKVEKSRKKMKKLLTPTPEKRIRYLSRGDRPPKTKSLKGE
jgi:hypothetical protein